MFFSYKQIFCIQTDLYLTIIETKDNSNKPVERHSISKLIPDSYSFTIDGFSNINIHIEKPNFGPVSPKTYISNYELIIYNLNDKSKLPKLEKDSIYNKINDNDDIQVQLNKWNEEYFLFKLIINYREEMTYRKSDTIYLSKKFSRVRFLVNIPGTFPESDSWWNGLINMAAKTQVNVSLSKSFDGTDPYSNTIFHIPFVRYECRNILNQFEIGFELPVNLIDKNSKVINGWGVGIGGWRTKEDRTLFQLGICTNNQKKYFWFLGAEIPTLFQIISDYVNSHQK
jgi:hypothetical protein